MDKLEDISVLFFAGSNCCPYSFAPAHTGLAASALCYPTVDYGVVDFAFGPIVGWFDVRIS